MNRSIDVDTGIENVVSIKVIGVGGGGCNAVNRMCVRGKKSSETLQNIAA